MAARKGAASTVDVEAVRREIPGVDSRAYLNTGGLGLMPQVARQEIRSHYDRLGPAIDPTNWYRECVSRAGDLRERIAGFVGAGADEIALKTSVVDGFGSVLWGLGWHPGDEVLVVSEEHPSPRLAVELAAHQFGLTVRTVPVRPTGAEFLDELGRALGPRTRLIAMSHVTTDSGTCLPAEQICRLAHERGALVLLDGAQAVGQMPLDLDALGCDFYAAMGYKWALGPMGSGFLYVRRARLGQLHPIVGAGGLRWQDLAAGRPDEPGTAARFEFASRPWPEFFALGRSLEFLDAIGVHRIQEHARRLAADARRRLAEIPGVEIHTPAPPEPSTGILAFSLAGLAPADLSRALLERWNVVQRAAYMVGRQGGIRISFAVYSAPHEVDRLVEAVHSLSGETQR